MGKGKIVLIATGITVGILGLLYVNNEATPNKSNCITVHVDYGVLSDKTPTDTCVVAHKKTNALTVLSKSGYAFKYIDFGRDLGKAVCTVNKLPKIKCDEMDWTSYWGVFERHGSNTLNANSHWNMSQKGLSFIELNPGDSIGMVYLKDGKVRYPNDNNN